MSDFSSWINCLGSVLAFLWVGVHAVFAWISRNANGVTAFSTFILMIIAWVGLSSWRKQLEGTTKHRLATDLLESILIYRNALKRVRAFEIDRSEAIEIEQMHAQKRAAGARNAVEELAVKPTLKTKEKIQEQDPARKTVIEKELEQIKGEQWRERLQLLADTKPLKYQLRLQRAADARRRVESLLLKAEVSFGDEIMGLASTLIDLEGQLWEAYIEFVRELDFVAANPRPCEDFGEEEPQEMTKGEVDARAWRIEKAIGEGSDEFDIQLQKEIDRIKDKLRSYARSSR
jgi:hypothetical protein